MKVSFILFKEVYDMEFFSSWIFTVIFYSSILLLVYFNRSKFEIQAKIVALYRTKFGLKLMNSIAKKFPRFIRGLAYVGIPVGFIGMIFILGTLCVNLYNLFMKPAAQSAVSLVIPGVNFPGSVIAVPLITGWIALFIVIVVHEFSHGVVARAHNIKVKSSGFAFFGPLLGAFVEPDEKQLMKAKPIVQNSIYAAGPWSNILLGVFSIILLLFVFMPLKMSVGSLVGVTIDSVQPGFPAAIAGMPNSTTVTQIDDVPIVSFEEFSEFMTSVSSNQSLNFITNQGNFSVLTTSHPDNSSMGYIGVVGFTNELRLKNDYWYTILAFMFFGWVINILYWVQLLSVGIGLANLLPLGPVDGGRMVLTSLSRFKNAKKIWTNISLFALALLLLNVFWPLLKGVIGLFI